MTVDELEAAIRTFIKEGRSSLDSYNLLKRFAAQGGTKDEAKRVLGQLHGEVKTEQAVEHVETLLDVVEGWCLKEVMIWE